MCSILQLESTFNIPLTEVEIRGKMTHLPLTSCDFYIVLSSTLRYCENSVRQSSSYHQYTSFIPFSNRVIAICLIVNTNIKPELLGLIEICAWCYVQRPCGARLWNLCDASAKSSIAPNALPPCILSCLPCLPCDPPPRISVMSLNAVPIFLISVWRRPFSFGQSTRTWTTVSGAPHSHLSSSLKRCSLACVASHEIEKVKCLI